jgi:hypothetical protein
MMKLMLALLLSTAAGPSEPGPLPDMTAGAIQGVVVDGTHGGDPLEGIDVLLRAGQDGNLIVVATTKTDRYGKFVFEEVPPDPELVYVAGANRDGVHYPAQRVRINPVAKVAHVRIVAYEATAGASPLVAARHDIEVCRQRQALQVAETILVRNPTLRTYVGRAAADGSLTTLQLAIPQSYERVTFAKEFYGRRFKIVDGGVVTDLPWPPGERKLKFIYHVPIGEGHGVFERPIDLPCPDVRLIMRGEHSEEVSCNLPRAEGPNHGLAVFESVKALPAGYHVTLSLGKLPIPWADYARWGTLVALGALVVLTVLLPRLRSVRRNSGDGCHTHRGKPADRRLLPPRRRRRAA